MKSLTNSSVSSTAVAIIAFSDKKVKTLPRSKFTRNKLRSRIQERELKAEIQEALVELHNVDQDYFEDGDDRGDDWLWDPYVEERWDSWRNGCCGFGSANSYYEDELDDPRDRDDGDYDFDPCYYDRPSFDYDTGYIDEPYAYRQYPRRYRFEDCWPPEQDSTDAGVSLGDLLTSALRLRQSELACSCENNASHQGDEVPNEYYDEPDLPAAVYERLRFSTERFVRRPGRKVRFKKNKEQRGGNRRGRCDYSRTIYKFMDEGRYDERRLHLDGSRKIQSLSRHAHNEFDCTIRARLEKEALSSLKEMVQEYYEDRFPAATSCNRKGGAKKNRHSKRNKKLNRNRTRVVTNMVVAPRLSAAELAALTAHVRGLLLAQEA